MKVFTAQQMREADRITIERGTPGEVLMENAGRRVAEAIERHFSPLRAQRVLVVCGKGNNGGDGRVVARLLRGRVAELQEIDIDHPQQIRFSPTVIVDAILGTGLSGPARGAALEWIRKINSLRPPARVVAVDIPSGLGGGGEFVRADVTVTFAAFKVEHFFAEGAEEAVGALMLGDIGVDTDAVPCDLETSEMRHFAALAAPRTPDSHKGNFGHVLIIGGAPGKAGAAAMAGLAAARIGAGLTTVACSDPSRLAPELMSDSLENFSLEKITVIAVGPGLGPNRPLMERLLREAKAPMVIDADGLNSIAGSDFRGRGVETILTPHPGEMARLMGAKFTDRLSTARDFAKNRNCCVVLKGHRTLIALPDGRVWINTTGSPAMAKGGSGDVLTGMIAGMAAQFPGDIALAVRAAVFLHGRCGEFAAEALTDKCVLATDLLHYLPRAFRECL
ncbi:MAG TPA: NAD(P)H-hydrate dehydratase [Bryobacteraceae bacterium]|nr:NAD(P)H-hydrate dehydratase [Bryobacteraceae bacterium]